ncbi:hypothetical protein H0H92_004073 [Tricholoma furcatifolium]|nr:hypothetical protein H0H92_004073 [Tricholoma furcatifolium]
MTREIEHTCHSLAEHEETSYGECKWVDASIEGRADFYRRLSEWMAGARNAKASSGLAKEALKLHLIRKAFNLEHGLGKYINVGSVARARARHSVKGLEEGKSFSFFVSLES